MLLFGVGCYARSRLFLIAALIGAFLFDGLVRLYEEPFTEQRLGEAYREYKRRTPRWLPRIRRRLDGY